MSMPEEDSVSVKSSTSGPIKRRPNKCCADDVYGRKGILTAAVCWSYVVLGWVVCQIGTALPDLQRLAAVDLKTASWLFTSWSIGYVIGSLVSGVLYDRLNRLAMMLVSTLGIAACSFCLPHSGTFTGMVMVRFLTGVFCGGLDTGANTIVPSIWHDKGRPFMQALYLSYSVGGIASPLATRPFMLHRLSHHSGTSRDIEEFDQISNVSNYADTIYYTADMGDLNQVNLSMHDIQSNHSHVETIPEGSSIHYAFILTGVLVLTSAVPYVVMCINGKFETKKSVKETSKEKSELLEKTTEKDEPRKSTYTKYLVLMCVAGINMTYGATEDSLGDFIVTFCLDYLGWDNSASVSLSSLYWVTSCFAGLGGILIMRMCAPTHVLFVALVTWNASFLAIVFASLWKIDILVWVSLAVSGCCMVLIIPTVISWTSENVCEISGKVSSLITVATGVGLAANPSFIGYMMEKYDYIYFFYILLGESVLCTLLFALASIINKCNLQPPKLFNIDTKV